MSGAVTRASGLAVLLAASLALATPGSEAAPSPQLTTDQPCYLENTNVRITGAGFTPGAPYTVTLDRHAIGAGTVRSDGTMSGTLASGALHGRRSARRRLQVFDGKLQGRTAFDLTALAAGFTPSTGDPRVLTVRFSVLGIGLGLGAAAVYLHYLDPRGHLRATVAVGRTRGRCGSIPASRRHRLFPFSVAPGRWRLQFDLARTFSRHRRPRIVRTLKIS